MKAKQKRFKTEETNDSYQIFDNKTNMICLIIPKNAYKDPKSSADGFCEILEISSKWGDY